MGHSMNALEKIHFAVVKPIETIAPQQNIN